MILVRLQILLRVDKMAEEEPNFDLSAKKKKKKKTAFDPDGVEGAEVQVESCFDMNTS